MEDYLEIKPFLLDSQEAMYKIEKKLGDLIGIEAIVQGFKKDKETENKVFVEPKPLGMFVGKHSGYHEGKWGDQNPPHDPPKGQYGVAYVSLEGAEKVADKVDHVVKDLDGTGFANSFINVKRIVKPAGDDMCTTY